MNDVEHPIKDRPPEAPASCNTQQRPILFAVILTAIALTTPLQAAHDDGPTTEPRWGVSIDNDLFSPNSKDSGYTGGFNITYFDADLPAGKSQYNPLNLLDAAIQLDSAFSLGFDLFSLEVGGFGLTPSDITRTEPDLNDRPYASLIYVATTRERVSGDQHYNLSSTLIVGALGLDLIEGTQTAIHDATDSTPALGWNNQISNDGELTAQYAVSMEENIATGRSDLQIKKAAGMAVGYITELNYSVGFRVGKLRSPWWSFKPERTSYSVGANRATLASIRGERFFWFGFATRIRAYNALLQGQFRSSAVTYSADEVRPIMFEAWAGITSSIYDDFQIGYQIRGHTSEVQRGKADRNLIWGGLTISRQF